MATSLTFVPSIRKSHLNAVLDGYRFSKETTINGKTFWKCVHQSLGCKARIQTVDQQLITPVPQHLFPNFQHAEAAVHLTKQIMKQKAATSTVPTKLLAGQTTLSMFMEARVKPDSQTSSLSRMDRRARQAGSSHSPQVSCAKLPGKFSTLIRTPIQSHVLHANLSPR